MVTTLFVTIGIEMRLSVMCVVTKAAYVLIVVFRNEKNTNMNIDGIEIKVSIL